MYKLITVDLDGTLLNSRGEVSPRTKESIRKSIEKGTDVVLASGRPTNSVENIAYEIGSKNYLISGNGAIVYDIANKKIIYNRFLSKEQVLNIVRICYENSIYCNVYTENEVIAQNLNYNVLFYYKENAKKEEGRRTHINIVPNLYRFIQESTIENYLKITVCDPNNTIFNGILRKLKAIDDVDVLDVAHMSRKVIRDGSIELPMEYYYTEITNKNVNKWTAIEYLISTIGISKEEVIGIGDNVNDKEMIENAGLGVAMGNSTPDFRDSADIIVSDNNSDGVAEVIEKYVLNE